MNPASCVELIQRTTTSKGPLPKEPYGPRRGRPGLLGVRDRGAVRSEAGVTSNANAILASVKIVMLCPASSRFM